MNILTAVFYVSDVKKIREQHFDFDFLIHSSGSQPLCDGFSPLFPFKWAIIWQWLTESFCHVLNYIFSDCICIYGGVSIYIYIHTLVGGFNTSEKYESFGMMIPFPTVSGKSYNSMVPVTTNQYIWYPPSISALNQLYASEETAGDTVAPVPLDPTMP